MKKILQKYIPLAYGIYFNGFSLFSKKKAASKAFSVFCTVRKGKVLPHQKEFLDKAKSTKEKVKEHTLQSYQWEGKKETVLLLHGWESNTFRWRNLISKLKEADFNIIAFDAPAHGHSTGKELNVPLYTECTQHFIEKHKPQHIIAHSVGGMNALYNQYKYPDSDIKKVVTIGAPSELSEIMGQYKTTLKYNTRVEKALDNYFIERFGFKVADFSTSKFVQSNTKKGLLFHDELDAIAPFHASEKVHANWQGSTFIKTKGLGHSMHQEEVNNKIVAFLK
ncbi:MAG: alpha/beta hydrolase [Flavobacteriaceae bacterium]|nr:MAG: alpha/beta hydrolase [Flavobacteriaceae bacterium]